MVSLIDLKAISLRGDGKWSKMNLPRRNKKPGSPKGEQVNQKSCE